jgi:hypothetical protein
VLCMECPDANGKRGTVKCCPPDGVEGMEQAYPFRERRVVQRNNVERNERAAIRGGAVVAMLIYQLILPSQVLRRLGPGLR